MRKMQQIEILLVEDDPADVELTKEAMLQSKIVVNLNVVIDGEQALEYLQRNGEYKDSTRPDMVLLDLNLPKLDGRDVLKAMKQNDDLKTIPVIVLTTSKAEEDIVKSYGLGANCFITKPVGLEQFTEVVRSIEDFWFTIVRLPTRE